MHVKLDILDHSFCTNTQPDIITCQEVSFHTISINFIIISDTYAMYQKFCGVPVAQQIQRWPANLASRVPNLLEAEIIPTINGVSLQTTFHQPLIVLM